MRDSLWRLEKERNIKRDGDATSLKKHNIRNYMFQVDSNV